MNHQSELDTAEAIQECPTEQATVLSPRHEVVWPNGSVVGLHPVRQGAAHASRLRALHHDGNWVLFDLARVLKADDIAELKAGPSRDQPGLVMLAMRRRYHSAQAFTAAAENVAKARWAGEPRPATPRPPAGCPLVPPVNKPTPKRAPATPRVLCKPCFIQTTGDAEFLGPNTGNRRFWPLPADGQR